ncbi:MAG: carboxypeptidase-like regulatory domain-containing protein [Solirubrobacteraceae bacterium]
MLRRALTPFLAALLAAPAAAPASAAAAHSTTSRQRGCRVPHLVGLTLAAARRRAAQAGCALRVKGARLQAASVQKVRRQAPSDRRSSVVATVWIDPLCRRDAARAPEIHEPLVTPGPTELVSGFYLAGGPLGRPFSAPSCNLPQPAPQSGTIEVLDASGAVVATQTSEGGYFVEIPLAPGSYTIDGTFLDAASNGARLTQSRSIVIPPGHTVRQDFVLAVP